MDTWSMLQFPHINPLIEESSPTLNPETKTLSGHDNSTETFCKMIYRELTDGEGEYRTSLIVKELRVPSTMHK